jgi:phosphate transport system protein
MTPKPRLHFRDELRQLEGRALSAFGMVVESLGRTLAALRDRDLELAELVVADDDRIDGRYVEVHQGVLSLIARQAPVATDLRVVAALLDVIGHVERMGDQCVNIAKVIPLAGAPPRDDGGMLELVLDMGVRAKELVLKARAAFERRDVAGAEDLVRLDDVLDRLNRGSVPLALKLAGDERSLEWAVRMVQVARWLERIGDHAVDIGEQAAFVATGHLREFTDASHPELRPAGGAEGAV